MSDFLKHVVNIDNKQLGYSHPVTISKLIVCPCCHKSIDAIVETQTKTFLQNNKENTFAVIFRCPACGKYFFKSYKLFDTDNEYIGEDFISNPTPDLDLNIPKEIKKISPKFIEIYTQALTAEHYGLTEITGIGLRKSIEFLVKDYLIDINPEISEDIQELFLGRAIEKIDNPKIKNLAKAAVWLGNDETHYLRIHEDKDIKDMKKFIKALLYFISFEVTADEAEVFTASSKVK